MHPNLYYIIYTCLLNCGVLNKTLILNKVYVRCVKGIKWVKPLQQTDMPIKSLLMFTKPDYSIRLY